MSKSVTMYDLLISCPGDVSQGVDIIKTIVENFNRTLGETNNVNVRIRYWKSDSYPTAGDTPQNILNQQLVEKSDLVVAIFGNRFGTPTEKYGSGTEEEIEKMINDKKQVFLYFLNQKVNPVEFDLDQFKKLTEFKNRFNGLYGTLDSFEEFGKSFTNHLNFYFINKFNDSSLLPIGNKKPNIEIFQHKYISNIEKFKDTIYKDVIRQINTTIHKIEAIELSKSITVKLPVDTSNKNTNEFQSLSGEPMIHDIFSSLFNPLSIDQETIETIENYTSSNNIQLSDTFFLLGNLKETFQDLSFINGSNLSGTDAEKKKYLLINDLYSSVIEYSEFKEYFDDLEKICFSSFYLKNSGTSFDEDIDIKIKFNTEDVFDFNKMPVPKSNIISLINDLEFLESIFIPPEDENIEAYPDYPDYPITNIVPYIPLTFNQNLEEKYDNQKNKYLNTIKRIFCYKTFSNNGNITLTFKLNYLKQYSSVSFPSYILFIKNNTTSINYTITSKHHSEVVDKNLDIVF